MNISEIQRSIILNGHAQMSIFLSSLLSCPRYRHYTSIILMLTLLDPTNGSDFITFKTLDQKIGYEKQIKFV